MDWSSKTETVCYADHLPISLGYPAKLHCVTLQTQLAMDFVQGVGDGKHPSLTTSKKRQNLQKSVKYLDATSGFFQLWEMSIHVNVLCCFIQIISTQTAILGNIFSLFSLICDDIDIFTMSCSFFHVPLYEHSIICKSHNHILCLIGITAICCLKAFKYCFRNVFNAYDVL